MAWIDDSEIALPDSQYERALTLQSMLVALATGGDIDEEIYSKLRREFMADPRTRRLLPECVRTCRLQEELWGYLKAVARGSGSYEARRRYLSTEFQRILEFLETSDRAPSDDVISNVLSSFDAESVHGAWDKALARRYQDPEGAITAARTLLEAVCKRVLEECGEEYATGDDLPKLYGKTANALNLAPSQHTEQTFKSILGGCHTIVQNLGTLRNRIGDAHGHGRQPVRPRPRHAALAVNLAGTMATFIVETWQARLQQGAHK